VNDAVNTEDKPAKTRKSIVPAGWVSKGDALRTFIQEQCKSKDGFDYNLFFQLCRNNGLPEEQVAKYEEQVLIEKRLGSQGRAVMTLRNMLATIARKDGKLKDLDGDEIDMELPKAALGGAAKAAADKRESGEAQAEGKF